MNLYLFVLTDGPIDPQQILAAGQLLQRLGLEGLAKQRLNGSDDASAETLEGLQIDAEPATAELDEAVNYLERCFDQRQS